MNKSSKSGSNGFNDKPHWIPGRALETAGTVARTVYTGSVWVKADVAGEKLTLFLRELNAAGAPMNKAPYNVGVTVDRLLDGMVQHHGGLPRRGYRGRHQLHRLRVKRACRQRVFR